MEITTQKYSSFIANLQKMGFIIGTGHYLQLQAVLNLAGEDSSDLKYLLCPVFAKSEKQQAQFYREFDRFFKMPISADKDKAEPVQVTITPPKWKYLLFGILLLANVVFFALIRDDIRLLWKNTSQEAPITPPVVQNQKPLPPIEKPKPEKTFYQQYWQIIRWIAILTPILIFLLTEWYRYDRRKLILQRESSRKPSYTWKLNIEAPDIRFLKNEQFYTAARLQGNRMRNSNPP